MKKSTKSRIKGRIDLRAIGRRIRELRGFDMTQADFARRIGVAVADEPFAGSRFVNCCLEGPTRCSRITELNGGAHLNSHATLSASYSQEAGMGDIPPISKIRDIAVHHGNVVQSN